MTTPFLLGLTGSIGMGKSTTARIFADLGCAVWDADAAVHRLYAKGGEAVSLIGAFLPQAIKDGSVSREALKKSIQQDPTVLAKIEQVVHPLVAQDRERFIKASTSEIIVLDIPLLFENGTEKEFDAVAVVAVDQETQRHRVLSRDSMSAELFEDILAKQIPSSEKEARADFVIPTYTLDGATEAVTEIVAIIKAGEVHA